MTLFSILWLGLAPHVARADCPSVDVWSARAEEDIVALRLAEARQALTQAEAGLSCGPPTSPGQLGRFWRAEGVLLTLEKRLGEASQSFEAARRVDPGVWTPAFGPELEKVAAAAPAASGPSSALRLDPWSTSYHAYVDGRAVILPATVTPGLHVVQASRGSRATGANIEVGKVLLAADGSDLVVSTPFPRDPGLVEAPPDRERGSRRVSLALAGGGGAAMLAGAGLFWIADQKNPDYSAALDGYLSGRTTADAAEAQVSKTHGQQVGLVAAGGALAAAGAGAVVVGVIRW